MEESVRAMLSENKVAGLRQVLRGIRAGQIRCVLMAKDADEHIKIQLNGICKDRGIPMVLCESKAELGDALGIDIACATVGFLKY